MKRVSVVILNWNGVDMLRKFIPSVMDNSVGEGIEICVADNASSDGSLEMLRSEFPVVRLIELDQNYGFAEGYNRALEQVDAEYVVLLNSDVEVTPHWLEPLLDYMDTHSGTVACQPKLLSWHNKEYFEYAGASGGFIDRYGYPFCRGRIFDVVEKDCGQYDTVTEVMWVTGAALLSGWLIIVKLEVWMVIFLPTWKKLTCAGVCAVGEKSLSVFRKVWYIM